MDSHRFRQISQMDAVSEESMVPFFTQCFGQVNDNTNRFSSNYNRSWKGNPSSVGRNYNFNNVKTRGSSIISNRQSSHLNEMSEQEVNWERMIMKLKDEWKIHQSVII